MELGGRNMVRRGRRYGVCHRCGWVGMVDPVRRRDRRRLQTGRSFGRLCQECTTDLLRASSAEDLGGHRETQHKPERVRRVA